MTVLEERANIASPESETGVDAGDQVEAEPDHTCPTVNPMDEMLIARGGHVIDA